MRACKSKNEILRMEVEKYLSQFNKGSPPPPEETEGDLLDMINTMLAVMNAAIFEKQRKYKLLTVLTNNIIADILLFFYHIINLHLKGGSYELAIYVEKGEKEGLYSLDENEIKMIAEKYNPSISETDLKEVVEKLKRKAPKTELTTDKDLIAVNNGIFDYKKKLLLSFSPDMVFISKSRVDYNPLAKNIVIYNPQDKNKFSLDSWMGSLSDNPRIVNLLWELVGAVIRPNVSWNKSVWLYSQEGNNGKGSLCKLMRNICGEDTCDSINISQFSNDAYLENLMKVSAVITDENPPGAYLDGAENLKAAITGDVISINRKYRSKVQFIFRGLIVQCINEYPKLKDRTPSFLRRLLIIPMNKCFTGQERKYIKEDYLNRKEVLEYALYKVLNMNYYSFTVPEECGDMLKDYQEFNDPVTEFWNTFREEFTWDLLPFKFLFDLYKSWHDSYCPSGKLLGFKKFCSDLRIVLKDDIEWAAMDFPVTVGQKMNNTERLIGQYKLNDWMDPNYQGINEHLKYRPAYPKSTYRGLIRQGISNLTSGDMKKEGE